MIERLRQISYFFAYAVATIPLWHYIRDGRILALMVAVVTFAYVMVILSSVQIAQPILSSEKSKTTLPRWLPDKPKYHKWWILVRRTLKWHLLLVIPKMALALGFVQWLRSIVMNYPTYSQHFLLKPYIYLTHIGIRPLELTYPQLEAILVALIITTLFGSIGCILFSAVTVKIWSVKLSIQYKFMRLAFTICLVIIVICTSQFIFTGIYGRRPQDRLSCDDCPVEIRIEMAEQDQLIRIQYRKKSRFWETLNISIFTLIDNGILLNANIMRPPVYHNGIYYWGNRPFVARQIVAGVLGLMLYAGTTWVILWFVEDEYQ